MKRIFGLGLLGSLIGSAMLWLVFSATGAVAAPSSLGVRSAVSQDQAVAATSMTPAFTYQGQLKEGGSPVSGTCDFQFRLYDALSGGSQIGGLQPVIGVSVDHGLFTVLLNAGNAFGDTAFNGDARWLQVAVRCPAGSGSYTTLAPRQPLTALPFALPGLHTLPNSTSPNVIGGSSGNSVSPGVVGAVIGGGGHSSIINSVQANYATVGGGELNSAGGVDAVVSGGYNNHADGNSAVVAGGTFNHASGTDAVVGGGSTNTASGSYAAVVGGYGNTASGYSSFAAGQGAEATADGTFVWADDSTTDPFVGYTTNSFIVRASGGIYLDHGTPGTPSGRFIDTWTGAYLSDGGVWTNFSDRNAKANFTSIDSQDILQRVAALPILGWNYKTEAPSIHHIGPTAQDFYAAFKVGADDTHIATIDEGGVALAAIQGLYQSLEDRDAQIAALQQQNSDLNTRVSRLEQAASAGNSPLQAGSFGVSTLLSMIAIAGFVTLWLGQRRSKRGQA